MALTKVTGQVIKNTTDVTVGVLTVTNTLAVGGTVSIGGTLTYEDVTNVDAVGLITARNGIVVGSGITLSKDGDGFFTGIVTATSFSGSGANLTGIDTDLVSDTSPQLGGNLDVNTKNIVFGDSSDGSSDDVLKFGAGSDLSLFHNGTDSRIVNTTGDLSIRGDSIKLTSTTGEEYVRCTANGSTELFYDNTVMLTTNSDGYRSNDSVKAQFGVGSDLTIYHNGTHNYIDTLANKMHLRVSNGEDGIVINSNGAVELYHDNVKTFETSSEGIIVQGTENGGGVIGLYADEGDDNADKWQLVSENNGTFQIKNYSSGSWENVFQATGNGAVELYYDNSKKFETQSSGVTVTGSVYIPDNEIAGFGDVSSPDLRIYHAGGSPGTNIIRGNTTSPLAFWTNGTERGRFLASGGLTFNGDTASANALDDYEEGTWTPAFSDGETLTNNQSTYTRIGRLVVTNCYISNFSNFDGNNAEFRITGLPFPAHNAQGGSYHGGGMITYAGSMNYSYPLLPLVGGNNTYIYFHRQDGTASSWKFQDFHNTGVSSGAALIVQMIYETDY